MFDSSLLDIKHIKKDVLNYINKGYQDSINEAIKLINLWLDKESWETKTKRKQLIRDYDFTKIVPRLFTHIITMGKLPLLSMAESFHLCDEMDILDNTKTVMELLVVLCDLGIYDIAYNGISYNVYHTLELPELLQNRLELSCFVPPKQEYVQVSNNQGLILGGKFNAHEKPTALDVINKMNKQCYVLDDWFIANHQKPWFRDDSDIEFMSESEKAKYQQGLHTWEKYKEQLMFFIKELSGKPIYFNHKYDKRGRIYAQGYHFNTQGTSYEKACINLCKQELITGEL